MTPLSAAVVGLGKMGLRAGGASDDRAVVTHAAAYAAHPGFDLVGAVDIDPVARAGFEARYRQPAFASIPELRDALWPEVVAIAVPTPLHEPTLREVLADAPRAVVCEKPLAETLLKAERMVQAAEDAHCALAVNYMRRFEPGTQRVRSLLARDAIGELLRGSAWYLYDLVETGSHYVDLLTFLLGAPSAIERLGARGDPAPPVLLRYGDVPIYLLPSERGSASELELRGTEGQIRYLQGGRQISLHRTTRPASDPSTRMYDLVGEDIPSDLSRFQLHVVDAVHKHLQQGIPLPSDGHSALMTLELCEEVLDGDY